MWLAATAAAATTVVVAVIVKIAYPETSEVFVPLTRWCGGSRLAIDEPVGRQRQTQTEVTFSGLTCRCCAVRLSWLFLAAYVCPQVPRLRNSRGRETIIQFDHSIYDDNDVCGPFGRRVNDVRQNDY